MDSAPTFHLEKAGDFGTADDDAFGHAQVAEVLAASVMAAPSPFTLGLFGPWGTGKTSILLETKRRLQNRKREVAFVVFDVWRYEGDSLRRAFLTDVSEQLKAGGWLKTRFSRDALLDEMETDVVEPRERLRVSARDLGLAAFFAVVTFLGLFGLLGLLSKLGMSQDIVTKTYPAIIGASLAFVLTALSKTLRVEQVQVRTPMLQDPDLFARKFEELLRDGLKPDRLVLAVDNLDRCTPTRVTELLATIKTFLEPAGQGKQLVFVLATDDEALRRHLTAQELGARPEGTDSEHDAEEFVDEYLRKFFNASIRVGSALYEEIHGYTGKRLADFFDRWKIGEDERLSIVDMVASALKSNPRRITQFVNNLELRLVAIRSRENSGRIQPPVSASVPLIAKLLIIEEEFRTSWRDLCEDPRRLRRWHAEASKAATSDAREVEGFSPERDAQFALFLRATDHISDDNLRAVIEMKQGEQERKLPRYADFTRALDEGVATTLEDVLNDDPSLTPLYVGAILPHFQVQLKRSAAEAVNTVRLVVGVDQLGTNTADVTREVIGRAALEPRVVSRLTRLPTAQLLEAGALAADDRFNRIVQVLANSVAEDEVPDDPIPLAAELVPFIERLSPTTRQALRAAYDLPPARERCDDYLPLVEADSGLLPPRALEAALAALPSGTIFEPTSAPYRVAVIAVDAGAGGGELLGRVVAAVVAAAPNDQEAGAAIAESARTWLPTATLGDGVPTNAAQQLSEVVPQYPFEEPLMAVARLMFVLMGLAPPDEIGPFAHQLVDRLIELDDAVAVRFFEGELDELVEPAQARLGERLEIFVAREAGAEDVSVHAQELLERLPNGAPHIANAAIRAHVRQQPSVTTTILGSAADTLTDEQQVQVADACLSQAAGYPPEQRGEALAPLLSVPASAISAELRERVEAALLSGLQEAPAFSGVGAVVDRAAGVPAWASAREHVLRQLAEWIPQHSPSFSPVLPQVVYLAERLPSFDASAADTLARDLLAALTTQPESATELAAPAAELLTGAPANRRTEAVDQLLTAERTVPTPAAREGLLRAADDLAGPHGRARDAVRSRLEQLKDGDDEWAQNLARTLLGES